MPIDPGTAQLAGSALSAGASLLGGALGADSSKKAQKRAWRQTKVMAQNQIQWRVADAQKAGIHPLAALGAQLMSPTMTATGSSMGDAIAAAGDALGRGVADSAATREALERQRASDLQSGLESDARIDLMRSQSNAAQAEAAFYQAQAAQSVAKRAAAAALVSPGSFMDDRSAGPRSVTDPQIPSFHAKEMPVVKKVRSPQGDIPSYGFTPAEDVEALFGDVASSLYGIAVGGYTGLSHVMDEAPYGVQRILQDPLSFARYLEEYQAKDVVSYWWKKYQEARQ